MTNGVYMHDILESVLEGKSVNAKNATLSSKEGLTDVLIEDGHKNWSNLSTTR